MALIVLCSAKGSPGVTTTSLALTLVCRRAALLVEADPAGGDVMAGYLRGQVPCDRGLLQLAIAARHGRLAEDFNSQLINLNRHANGAARLLLPGLTNPAQAATLMPAWIEISAYLSGLAEAGGDVIVDAGRLVGATTPWPLIAVADEIALVLRTTLRSVSAAAPVVERLQTIDTPRPLGLITIDGGDYGSSEVGKRLGAPVLAALPWQPREAVALSDGHGAIGGRTSLLRAVRGAFPGLAAAPLAAVGTPASVTV